MQDKQFKENIDSWIKELKIEVSKINEIFVLLQEDSDNIQCLYDLIYEMKDDIEKLKLEINDLKLIQILSIKQSLRNNGSKNVIQKT